MNAVWLCVSLNFVAVGLSHKNNQLSHLLQHLLLSLCESSLPLFSAVMESTPPISKRVKTRVVRSGGRLEVGFLETMSSLKGIGLKLAQR